MRRAILALSVVWLLVASTLEGGEPEKPKKPKKTKTAWAADSPSAGKKKRSSKKIRTEAKPLSERKPRRAKAGSGKQRRAKNN